MDRIKSKMIRKYSYFNAILSFGIILFTVTVFILFILLVLSLFLLVFVCFTPRVAT